MTNKILILRDEPQARRLLALTLADAGYDIRPFGAPAEALDCARQELFDLVIVDQLLPAGSGLDWIEQLRKVQPTVAVFLIAEQLDVAAVVQGIRLGVVDVLNQPGDNAAILRRTDLLLRPGFAAAGETISDDERLSAALQAVLAHPERQNDEQLLLKEREALAADWAAIHEEQLRLRKERHRLRNEAMVHEGELARFEKAWAEFDERQLAARTQLEQAQVETQRLTTARGQLEDDFERLREQEANLRDYEIRLRELQRQLETEQISRTRNRDKVTADAAELELSTAWDKIQRATSILEAERKNLIDERLAIKEHTAALQQREEALTRREAQLTQREQVLANPPPPAPPGKTPFLSKAPFLAAKSILTLGRS